MVNSLLDLMCCCRKSITEDEAEDLDRGGIVVYTKYRPNGVMQSMTVKKGFISMDALNTMGAEFKGYEY